MYSFPTVAVMYVVCSSIHHGREFHGLVCYVQFFIFENINEKHATSWENGHAVSATMELAEFDVLDIQVRSMMEKVLGFIVMGNLTTVDYRIESKAEGEYIYYWDNIFPKAASLAELRVSVGKAKLLCRSESDGNAKLFCHGEPDGNAKRYVS